MKRWMMLIAAVLMVFSLSCSVLSGRNAQEDGGAEATMEVEGPDDVSDDDASDDDASDDGAPDDGASDDENADDEMLSVDSDALTQLESYRATLQWRIEADDGTVTELEMAQSMTRDPAAQRFVMSSEDGDIEFIQIEDQMWIRFGEEWIQSSAGEDMGADEQFDEMISMGDDWAAGMNEDDYDYLGKETVNGIQTRHYQAEYNETWLNLFDMTGDEVGNIESGVADIWVADEANLPKFTVKFVITMEGNIDEETGSGALTMTMEVTDINEPITIEPPEGVAVGGLPDDLPLYPDAAEVTSMGAMTIFTAPDDIETVNEFYEEALTDNGWVSTGEGLSSDELINSSWEKGDQTLTLTISSGDEGTDVMIMVEGEE
jgi:hypothetical protein